jgi:pimeloyl-ACP methyl ester carboxylesterase
MASELAVRELGEGPRLVLVHGGMGPELTWERQEPLAERWRLVIPKRRGFPGSSPAERQDFDRDADDLAPLLGERAHLVGFSYGGVGSAIVSGREPGRIDSLTLVEAPIYTGAPDHPSVMQLIGAGDAFLAGQADELTEKKFLADAGIDPAAATGRTRELIEEAIEAARGGRPPSQAEPDLGVIASAGVPAMVVSGGHHAAIELICDAVAEQLDARRKVVPGAGHAVPRAPGFNEVLEEFLRGSGGTGRSRMA